MVLSYILITVNSGCEAEVASEILKYEQILNIHTLFGEYDLIVKAKSNSEPSLKTFIINKIRKTPNVITTRTLIVAD
ncbi:MAG: Lrp/AsnC ligand binding domain-containing protein [Nanoarchaeota archaeon]|nr:Lrp/AsnC ligand binding domain-containing protein [Nanoarchaeota archaeon]